MLLLDFFHLLHDTLDELIGGLAQRQVGQEVIWTDSFHSRQWTAKAVLRQGVANASLTGCSTFGIPGQNHGILDDFAANGTGKVVRNDRSCQFERVLQIALRGRSFGETTAALDEFFETNPVGLEKRRVFILLRLETKKGTGNTRRTFLGGCLTELGVRVGTGLEWSGSARARRRAKGSATGAGHAAHLAGIRSGTQSGELRIVIVVDKLFVVVGFALNGVEIRGSSSTRRSSTTTSSVRISRNPGQNALSLTGWQTLDNQSCASGQNHPLIRVGLIGSRILDAEIELHTTLIELLGRHDRFLDVKETCRCTGEGQGLERRARAELVEDGGRGHSVDWRCYREGELRFSTLLRSRLRLE